MVLLETESGLSPAVSLTTDCAAAFRFGESPEPGDNGLATLPEELQQDLRRGYYASISFTDFEVGRVLDELETMGFADNTAVLFHAVRLLLVHPKLYM